MQNPSLLTEYANNRSSAKLYMVSLVKVYVISEILTVQLHEVLDVGFINKWTIIVVENRIIAASTDTDIHSMVRMALCLYVWNILKR